MTTSDVLCVLTGYNKSCFSVTNEAPISAKWFAVMQSRPTSVTWGGIIQVSLKSSHERNFYWSKQVKLQ